MIRVIRENNDTLQIGTLQDRQFMESAASFPSYATAVDYLRRFLHDAYNMTVLRKVLYENSCQFNIHLLSDQEVISQLAREIVRGQVVIARRGAAQSTAGSSAGRSSLKEQNKAKEWSKKEDVAAFLAESKITSVLAPESKLHWLEIEIVDDYDNPISELDLVFSGGGEQKIITTNSSGKARWENVPHSVAYASVKNTRQLRDLVFPRWEIKRNDEPMDDGSVKKLQLKDKIAPERLLSETPRKLSIVPHVLQVRLIGMYFDNAKCFLLPSAMNPQTPQLA